MSENQLTETEQLYGTEEQTTGAETPTEKTPTKEPLAADKEVIEPTEKVEDPVKETEPTPIQVIELDGEETSLDDIRAWKQGHMMESDYRKKTTELSDERKQFEAERESERKSIAEQSAKLAENIDLLQVIVEEDKAIDWEDLKLNDQDLYIEKKELADKRQKRLEEIQAQKAMPDSPETIAKEQQILVSANPDWFKDGKPTDIFEKDMSLLNNYVVANGFSDEFPRMTKARYIQTLIKAAKYDQLQEKGRKVKQQREKVPVIVKSKEPAPKQEAPVSLADALYN